MTDDNRRNPEMEFLETSWDIAALPEPKLRDGLVTGRASVSTTGCCRVRISSRMEIPRGARCLHWFNRARHEGIGWVGLVMPLARSDDAPVDMLCGAPAFAELAP
jgi:hypothetical protein